MKKALKKAKKNIAAPRPAAIDGSFLKPTEEAIKFAGVAVREAKLELLDNLAGVLATLIVDIKAVL